MTKSQFNLFSDRYNQISHTLRLKMSDLSWIWIELKNSNMHI